MNYQPIKVGSSPIKTKSPCPENWEMLFITIESQTASRRSNQRLCHPSKSSHQTNFLSNLSLSWKFALLCVIIFVIIVIIMIIIIIITIISKWPSLGIGNWFFALECGLCDWMTVMWLWLLDLLRIYMDENAFKSKLYRMHIWICVQLYVNADNDMCLFLDIDMKFWLWIWMWI